MLDSTFGVPLTLACIRAAHERIRPHIHRTPVMTSAVLDEYAGAALFFKCENLQKAGAFKARGATNAVFSLSEAEARLGVATHSSGNHAAALARAAGLRDIPAYVVMPKNAPLAKQAAAQRYGGHIVLCEPTQEARESTAARIVAETGATLIHAYDDLRVMAGQGTTAIELLEDIANLDVILCPVGGGGILGGIAAAAKSLRPGVQVFGVEPEGADDAARSFRAGAIVRNTKPSTIADGLLTSLCDRTFAEIQRHVEGIVTVSEGGIIRAMRSMWEVTKMIVEPSGAVAYAAVGESRVSFPGKRVGVIVTGGNLDLDVMPWQRLGKNE